MFSSSYRQNVKSLVHFLIRNLVTLKVDFDEQIKHYFLIYDTLKQV